MGAGDCVTSCDLGVFVDQATEPVPAQNAHTSHFRSRMYTSGGRVAAVENPTWEGCMGRTARERLAKLLDDAEAPRAFSAQILAPADALRVEVDGVGAV
jgi:hypothetical protein